MEGDKLLVMALLMIVLALVVWIAYIYWNKPGNPPPPLHVPPRPKHLYPSTSKHFETKEGYIIIPLHDRVLMFGCKYLPVRVVDKNGNEVKSTSQTIDLVFDMLRILNPMVSRCKVLSIRAVSGVKNRDLIYEYCDPEEQVSIMPYNDNTSFQLKRCMSTPHEFKLRHGIDYETDLPIHMFYLHIGQ